MDNLVATAAKLQRFLEENKVPFCYVGGIAVQHWGEPRLTRDVDLTVLAPGSEESLTELIVQNWESRIVKAAEFAIESRQSPRRERRGLINQYRKLTPCRSAR